MKVRMTMSGGFHNSKPITFRVPQKAVYGFLSGASPLSDLLTKRQQSIAENHFCGVRDCKCASYWKADVEFSKRTLNLFDKLKWLE